MPDFAGRLLLIGASRGIGEAMAIAFADRGWHVTGTVRTDAGGLGRLAAEHPDRAVVERLDIADGSQIATLRERLTGNSYDILFVNAGIANAHQGDTLPATADDEFVRVMTTNVLGVVRAVDALADLVSATGTIGVMSSRQGSLANNTGGGDEVYRASKAALNQAMRSYAARAGDARTLVLLAPGWIRTAMGGSAAPVGLEEAVPQIVDTLLAARGRPGLHYLDRKGATVPW